MKISLRKRIIAFMLSVILLFSGSISGFASELLESDPMAEAAAAVVSEEATEPATEAATEATESSAAIISEEITEATEAATEEVTEAATEAVTEEATEAAAKEETVEETEKEIVEETETESVEETETETVEETEEVVQVLEYEDNDVKIHVEAVGADAIPEGASLKVAPITSGDAQYNEVEKQLNEKAEGEEYEIAGFLAYDITFVDKDGNKVEPNGNVRVTIDYKKATLPADVKTEKKETLDVTVMHFEENAKGEVKEVVDMVAATNIEATVKTTENAEVKKAEFVTDSFSIYTITWKSTESSEDGTEENRQIVGTIVTLTGKTFNVTDKVMNLPLNKIDSDVIQIGDLEFAGVNESNVSYVFNKAVVCQGAYDSAAAIEVTSINYVNGSYRANNNENYVITNNEQGYSLYFVYLKANTIATVNSNAANINIKVFDYSRYNETQSHTVKKNINDGHTLKFATNGEQYKANEDGGINRWTGTGGGPKQDIVKSNLSSGSPVLKTAGQSLSYLFSDGYNANYLFKKEDGYYVYRSSQNFAELDTATGNFTVYAQSKQGFFPFNKYSDDIKIEAADESASTKTNHHFGMHVDFSFMQPKAGKVNGADMVFEFAGDDDVWVFIDGMLVLDLGGIHEKTGGSINFATGKVTYNHTNPNKDTSIYEMYREALVEAGLQEDKITEKLNEYFVFDGTNYVFKDYSQHKLDFFYLERGAYDSNCEIKFNLISIPKDSVTVEKEITNYADGAYSDVEFYFNMYLQNGEKDSATTNASDPQDTLVTGAQYVHVGVDGTRTTKTVGADGVFKLKHKEEAIFSHLDVTTKFYIVETQISQNTYDKVEIVGSGVLNESGSSILDNQTSISSKTLEIGKDSYVLFQNRCAATNMKYLSIEKVLDESGKLEGNPDYTFRVTLGGALYTGKYKVGTSYSDALGSATELTATDGIIKLKKGQVAVVLGYATAEDGTVGIPSETSFKVEEINLDLNTYVPPKYAVTNADNIETVNTRNGWASGKINISKNAHVKVINALRKAEDSPEIKVSKTFYGLTQDQIDNLADEFEITVTSKNITPAVSKTLKLTQNGVVKTVENGGITYTWTLLNYPAGTYTVKEANETVAEYENVIEVNGNVVTSEVDITPTAATLRYTSTKKESSCSNKTYTVGNVNLIVAKLTQDQGYFVWTRQRVSVNERLGIVNLINAQDRIGFSTVATLNNCYFYSGSISDALVFKDGEIKYDGSQKLTFDDSTQWESFASGNYEVDGGDYAEIAFENTYTALTVDVDLKKVSVNSPELEGAEFALYKYNAETSTWGFVEGYETIAVTNATELVGLKAGRYKLAETKAPEGYVILGNDIYFKVENATVSLTDANGNNLPPKAEMWELDADKNILTVENDVLYALPSSGGIGIYWYMIAGMFLMMVATVIQYKNRREEVLERINRR